MATSPGESSIGGGNPVSGAAFEGIVVLAEQVGDVLALLGEDLSDRVLVTGQASATAFAPILPRLRGVVCTAGGEAAHLAIVSRGLGLPCVMNASLSEDPAAGDGIRVDDRGAVWIRKA